MVKSTIAIPKQRLIGIDLFRGFAAYAVVIIHTSKWMIHSGLATDQWIIALTDLSRFAVPFFLATFFYFMANNLYAASRHFSWSLYIKSKWHRLLVPYICWSTIYLVLRLIKALNRPDGLSQLFQDPVRIIFLGGASIHLYFLPLIFLGSFLITVPAYLARRQVDLQKLLYLVVCSLLIYELTIVTKNDFQFGSNCLENSVSCSVAFQSLLLFALPNADNNQLIRLLLVTLSWFIQCLPYLFIAVALNHPIIQNKIKKSNKFNVFILVVLFVTVSSFWIISSFKLIYFPRSIYELVAGFSLLIIGMILSNTTKNNWLINNLGKCSFGIYLMHYMILLFYAFIVNNPKYEVLKFTPTITLLILTNICFGTSWIITSLLLAKKPLSKFLFGN